MYFSLQDLSDNHLGVVFAEKFMDVLKQNSTLTHVTLTGNDLCDKAAVHIADGIMVSTGMQGFYV